MLCWQFSDMTTAEERYKHIRQSKSEIFGAVPVFRDIRKDMSIDKNNIIREAGRRANTRRHIDDGEPGQTQGSCGKQGRQQYQRHWYPRIRKTSARYQKKIN